MSDITTGKRRNFDEIPDGEAAETGMPGEYNGDGAPVQGGEDTTPESTDEQVSGEDSIPALDRFVVPQGSFRRGFPATDDSPEDGDDDGDGEDGEDSLPEDGGDSFTMSWNAPFSRLADKDNDGNNPFAGVLPSAWRPTMNVVPYIGTTSMLLEYLRKMEETYRMTMPIHACGIDPVVFEDADYVDEERRFFTVGEEGASDAVRVYELVEIDGALYMSCVSDSLNREYFEQVITAATCAIKEHGLYEFPLVGLRALGEQDDRDLLYTMRLNSFELNALISYMSQFPNISIEHIVNADQHQCIRFQLGA